MKAGKLFLILCLSFVALSSFVIINKSKPTALFNNKAAGNIEKVELFESEITVSDTNYVVSSFKISWILKDGSIHSVKITGNKLNSVAKNMITKNPLEAGMKVYFEEIKGADKVGKTIDLADLIFVIKE